MNILFIIILLIFCIGAPLIYAWRIWRLDEPSRAVWLVIVSEATVFVALVLIVGRWDMAGYYTRFVLLTIFLAAVLRSWIRHASRPWRVADGKPVWRSHWTTLVSFALFGAALIYVLSGLLPATAPREFAFPLKNGRFMIGQGGGVTLLNHHAGHREQRYAVDISAINTIGFRATGILPKDLNRYVIYGASVVSPCNGAVFSVQDGLADLAPPQADTDNPAGNHVVIDCDGVNVVLAHLQEGSIEVESGDTVAVGEAIGKVGNSGNTTEPHLHVHALDPENHSGVLMSFGGRVPFRNRLFPN